MIKLLKHAMKYIGCLLGVSTWIFTSLIRAGNNLDYINTDRMQNFILFCFIIMIVGYLVKPERKIFPAFFAFSSGLMFHVLCITTTQVTIAAFFNVILLVCFVFTFIKGVECIYYLRKEREE